jgi:hypothetical protein
MTKTKAKARNMESETMRRHDETVVATLPRAGLELTVRRTFVAGNVRYPVGSIVKDISVLGRGYASLMAGHFLEWRPGDGKAVAKAHTLPAPAPEKPRPAVEIIDDPDPVASWRRTVALMTERCDGNQARAKDLLLAHREGSALFLRATKIWTDSEAKRRNVVSVSPEGL